MPIELVIDIFTVQAEKIIAMYIQNFFNDENENEFIKKKLNNV